MLLRRALVLVALVVLPGWLCRCQAPQADKLRVEQVLRMRMRENPPDIDPASSADSLSDRINLAVHDGLVDFDPASLEVVPAVAQSWDYSSDGQEITFHLRPGVRFHNGRVLTSADVVYSFTRLLDPKVGAKRKEILEAIRGAEAFGTGKAASVEGIQAADAQTVRIALARPLPHFLQLLATPAASIVPKEIYDDPAKGYLAQPVGCGPFRVSRWERSSGMELAAFADYYGGRPKLDRIQVRFIENPAGAMEEYRRGGLDYMDEMVGSESAIAKELPQDYRKGPMLGSFYFGFNLARPPFKGNVSLRKALNYAVDRKSLCEQTFEGTLTPAHGILVPGTPGYNPDLKGYEYDPARARELLAQAGYPGGKGFKPIDLWVNNNQKLLEAAQKVQADLQAVGIPVRVKAVDFATFLQALQGTPETPGEALFYRYGWNADYPDPDAFLYWLLHSRNIGPAGNIGRYSNPKVDQLLDQARGLVRMEERIPLYREAERIAVEDDAAWLFLADYTQRVLIKPYVKGVVLCPLGSMRIPLDRLWIEGGRPTAKP
ncbi:MAG TPA: ABC transporter substrate-binding protein [Candidatus Polarisedimenticolia bacterium]|nr:ABC transporter substrate-binding protein [Candidatus Polarisedimenticolia bacterium]